MFSIIQRSPIAVLSSPPFSLVPTRIAQVRVRYFGENDAATELAVVMMKEIAVSYAAGEIVAARLYKLRDEKLVAAGIGPKSGGKALCHLASTPWHSQANLSGQIFLI
jgi:hypothetical protein